MTGPASHRPSRRDPGSRRDGPPPLQCAERWRREMTGDGVRPSWPAGAPSPTTTGSRHELTGQTAVTRRQKRSGGSPSTASAAAGMTLESLLSPERSALAMRRAGRWWTSPQPVPGAAAGIRLPPRGRAGHQGTRSDDLLPVDHDLLHEALLGCCLRQNLRDFLRALILAGDDTNHVVIHDALQLSEAGTIPQPNTASASRPATPGSAASAGFTYTSVGVTGSRGRALLHRQSSERLIRCPALAAFCVHSARSPGKRRIRRRRPGPGIPCRASWCGPCPFTCECRGGDQHLEALGQHALPGNSVGVHAEGIATGRPTRTSRARLDGTSHVRCRGHGATRLTDQIRTAPHPP